MRARRKQGGTTTTIDAVPASSQSFSRASRKQPSRPTYSRQPPVQHEEYLSARTRTASTPQSQRKHTPSRSERPPPESMRASSRFMVPDSDSDSFEEP